MVRKKFLKGSTTFAPLDAEFIHYVIENSDISLSNGCAILETKTDTQPPVYKEWTSIEEELDQSISTSTREIPAFFMERRPVESEPDKENEEGSAAATTNLNQEKAKYKERHNAGVTRARNRKRKMLHEHELEESVRKLTTETEIWKTRALTMRQLLQSHGVRSPDFEDISSSVKVPMSTPPTLREVKERSEHGSSEDFVSSWSPSVVKGRASSLKPSPTQPNPAQRSPAC
ncbi:hypothetical protein EV421DRAFT_1229788 [Armillaria borealis]|uniref:BZIP domain-containing protein n=1 Tax=Armillaria borealis TaxID=47425 RepID=A0AA39MJ34_9AGAR|nr:hypothetical protein EV421DRAFT_1229788 [Armillaria borealis]